MQFKEGEIDFIKKAINDLMDYADDAGDLELVANGDRSLRILDEELSLHDYKVFVQEKSDTQAEVEITASKNAWNNLYIAGAIDKIVLEEELKKLE